MDSAEQENLKTVEPARERVSSCTSSSQIFIADTLDLPDDTFRMSLDSYSVIGENVTIEDRGPSIESGSACMATETPVSTPVVDTPETPTVEPFTPPLEISTGEPFTPPPETSPSITETPKIKEDAKQQYKLKKPENLLKLSLIKNTDDVFVKPSPVAEVMSPARMLQFEVDACATPTMKRAAINFDFFKQNKFEEYFEDDSKEDNDDTTEEVSQEESSDKSFEETAVIVKAKDTVRHEIGYRMRSVRTVSKVPKHKMRNFILHILGELVPAT